ncbi:methyltransferase FkbM family [Methylobacterium nodulans ORS 2060]|uniref:Methyltransferase FkbM family n=1 Tax=Methylobacterium nodulans (strain LMG 21967 / CNCM I-2342 / ORS 2060) TaxID=460265 RepID=B8IQZ0_METNO|nr:FkbM family methyltransferase [Methylobacterium nodulans]ACL56692.1 methyltransferase FkbM family [Methylobacterium nodulans ORS 2060]
MVPVRLARKLTLQLGRVQGAHPVVEAIRRRSTGLGVQEVVDFDGDLRMALDLREQTASEIFWFGYHSRAVVRCLDRLLQPGQVLFDIGARFGEITLVAAKRVGRSGAVYAFEALETTHRKLAANVAANRLEQVRRIPCGVDAVPGTRMVDARAGRYIGGTLAEGRGGAGRLTAQVQLTTIDAVVGHYRLERLDGIRLDLEGAGLPALRGAAAALRRFAPWLLIELSRAEPGIAPGELAEVLCGYRLHRIGPDGAIVPLDRRDFGEREVLLGLPARRG